MTYRSTTNDSQIPKDPEPRLSVTDKMEPKRTEKRSNGTTGWQKFILLLWKNWVIQKRHPFQTVLETFLPLIFCVILVVVRSLVEVEPFPDVRNWVGFSVDKLPSIPRNDYGIDIPSNLSRPWPFAYAPNNTAVMEVMELVALRLNLEVNKEYGFKNEEDMVAYIMKNYNNINLTKTDFLGGVVFTNSFPDVGKFPDSISMKLRFRGKIRHQGSFSYILTWLTEFLFDPFSLPGPRNSDDEYGGFPGYYREGFLGVQHAISSAIIEKTSGADTSPVKIQLKRYPYPAYVEDYFVLVLQDWLGIILMLGFIYPVMNNVRNVVNEKERRLKESMKMMGLPNWLHWTAWFVKFFLFFMAMIIVMTIMLKAQWYGNGVSVVNKTDGTVLFLFYFVFSCSAISLCFLISTFFKSGSNAALGAGIIWFLLFAPSYFLQYQYRTMSRGEKYGVCLILNTGMALAMQIVATFEGTGAGVQWSTLFTPSTADDNFSLGDATVMIAVDGVIYLLLALYIEALFPGEFGVPKKWYFPFTRSFWCGNKRRDDYEDLNSIASSVIDFAEEEPKHMKAGVQITGLTKIYTKNKRAVNNISLNMYEGQITALLGHNGAGKTTTMAMLTGLYPPTSGTAYVNGFDIRTDIDSVRGSLGLCPQHDVLFDELTVEEHLVFFCKLKGLNGKEVPYEIDRILQMLRLEDKRYSLAKTLSGGMKRKLSVGIALCADSKVVMLDEPTSGMDPSSRRAIWDLLQSEKRGRTILLTTHFMDEADFLGDRTAIMASGEIQCVGSSLFLKKNYGGGYHLVTVKQPDCKIDDLTTLIKRYVPTMQLDQNVGAELSYALPGEYSHSFQKMFEELESQKSNLGISSYGMSVTTMEEVFFKVLQNSEDKKTSNNEKLDKDETAHNHVTISTGLDFAFNERNTGCLLYLQQLRAMLAKKMLFTLRNWSLVVTQLIVPVVIMIICLVILQLIPGLTDSPSLSLSFDTYRGTTTLVQTSNETESALGLMNAYKNMLAFSGRNKVVVVEGEDIIDSYLKEANRDLMNVDQHYVTGASFSGNPNGTIGVIGHFNNQPYHTPSLSLSLVQNAMLNYFSGSSNKSITVTNAPLPLDEKTKFDQRTQGSGVGYSVGYNVAFAHAFLAGSFVIFLVRERSANSKHLQFVSGVNLFTYWGANWIWDMFCYMIPCIGIMMTFLAFNEEGYISPAQQGRMFAVFLMYGWAVLPLVYLFSFMYKVPASAFTKIAMFFIFTGMATFIIVIVLSSPQLGLVDVSVILDWVFLLLPNYSLGMAFSNLYNNDLAIQYCTSIQVENACKIADAIENMFPNASNPFANGCCRVACGDFKCLPWTAEFFSWEGYGIGRMVTFLGIDGLVCMCVLILLEYKVLKRVRCSRGKDQVAEEDRVPEDSDVMLEKKYVMENAADFEKKKKLSDENTLVARELSKIYPGGFLAVNDLSFGVRRGECFGLLGINGAGKTTTFKMLTGDENVTSGDAFLEGFSVRSSIKKVQRRLGYCPQFDAVIEEMTGRETLRMFARLRGVPESSIDGVIIDLTSRLLLKDHIDKQVREMSGGNRRKLSTAVALVGDPPIIFLDEPTTGMDPVARRHLWNVMTEVKNSGKSIVLTSHSMEECEALCTRIAIMVNGTFRCMGSVQHLKSRFGQGYTLTAKLTKGSAGEEEPVQKFIKFIEHTFPGSQLKDHHQSLVQYNIPENSAGWSSIFGVIEEAKERFGIEDYAVGQTTLEQIFLRFAKDQKSDE